MTNVTDEQIGAYYDANLAQHEFPSMSDEHAAFQRARYIRDVRANPEAMRQLREILDQETPND